MSFSKIQSRNQLTISPIQIVLGAGTCGIAFLTIGADASASDALLLATVLDSRWGMFLPVLYTLIIARCVSKGFVQGLVNESSIKNIADLPAPGQDSMRLNHL